MVLYQPSGVAGSKTFEVALPAAASLASVRAPFRSVDHRFSDFTVEAWDASAWVLAATVAGNEVADLTVALNRVATDRLRLVASGGRVRARPMGRHCAS